MGVKEGTIERDQEEPEVMTTADEQKEKENRWKIRKARRQTAQIISERREGENEREEQRRRRRMKDGV